jgi:hypothetical protein
MSDRRRNAIDELLHGAPGEPFKGNRSESVFAFVRVTDAGDTGLLSVADKVDGEFVRWPLVFTAKETLDEYMTLAHGLIRAHPSLGRVELRRYDLAQRLEVTP